MSIAAAVSTFCDMLHASTGVEARLGQPGSDRPGIVVWPWRLEEDSAMRNQQPLAASAYPGTRAYPVQVHALVLVRPALEDLATLDQVYQAVQGAPVQAEPAGRLQVSIVSLSVEQLNSLFLAAGVPLSLCLSVLLRFTTQQVLSQEDNKVVEIDVAQRQRGKRAVKRKLVGV